MSTPNDPAVDLVIVIQEALRTPGANVVAIARRFLDAQVRPEWQPVEPKTVDWDTEYHVTLTGKNLEAMHYLSRFVLDKVRDPHPLPFGVIASADHLFCLAGDIRRSTNPPT